MKSITTLLRARPMRVAVVIALVAVAVFAGVRYAGGGDARAQGAPGATVPAATVAAASSSNTTAAGSGSCCATGSGAQTQASGGGSCCATGGSGAGTGASNSAAGTAQVNGNVQKISVDLSTGVYNPDVINLKAGVPAEITFGQSGGCTGYVQSQDLGFQADLTGGPQTVKLPALQPGAYGFACGMNMVRGEIVVK